MCMCVRAVMLVAAVAALSLSVEPLVGQQDGSEAPVRDAPVAGELPDDSLNYRVLLASTRAGFTLLTETGQRTVAWPSAPPGAGEVRTGTFDGRCGRAALWVARFEMVGEAEGLGPVEGVAEHCTYPPDEPGGAPTYGEGVWHVTLETGEVIRGTYGDGLIPSPTLFRDRFVITGGTGRFRGARGGGVEWGRIVSTDPADAGFHLVQTGSLDAGGGEGRVDPVAAFQSAWNRGDGERLGRLFRADGQYLAVPTGRLFRGPGGAAEYLGHMFSGAPDSRLEEVRRVRQGDLVAVEWVWRGTHTGDWPGLPATGREFSVRGVTVLELEGELVRRAADYWNRATLLEQLGPRPASEGRKPRN